jgi:thioredoxin reductase (NADPH)
MTDKREVIIVGGGVAGLSAAVYLGRALRDTLVIDDHKSLAHWEPEVQNYLGFPESIAGDELLSRGKMQASRFNIEFASDTIKHIHGTVGNFTLEGKSGSYRSERLLLATGIFHLPPCIEAVDSCLGHSMFFCKDCDGYRVRDKRVAIAGVNNETVEYALGLILYSPIVTVITNGEAPGWDKAHEDWLEEYAIPVFRSKVTHVDHHNGLLESLHFADGREVAADYLFTTRGDLLHNELGVQLGLKLDQSGQIVVDDCLRTSAEGVYAAGCITPANCQMIVAAGQGASAAQTINRDLFEASLKDHSLRSHRDHQLKHKQTKPEILANGAH